VIEFLLPKKCSKEVFFSFEIFFLSRVKHGVTNGKDEFPQGQVNTGQGDQILRILAY
jgi:hypothetical protein